MKDEHGMPLLSEETPLPWKVERDERISDRCGCKVEADLDGFPETLHFIVHAANWIIPCRDIVRRLATYTNERQLFVLVEDAQKLWDEMQREAKGGGK